MKNTLRRQGMNNKEENRVHKLDISLPSGAQVQEPEDFRKSKISGNQRFQEVEELKSKIKEIKDFRKSKN
jgi:hypothetical protein